MKASLKSTLDAAISKWLEQQDAHDDRPPGYACDGLDCLMADAAAAVYDASHAGAEMGSDRDGGGDSRMMATGFYVEFPRSTEEIAREKRDKERQAHNRDVVSYFEGLGYRMSWDGRYGCMLWHEILDSEGLVCQIDAGISLATIKEDLTHLHKGEQMGDKDYTIGVDNPKGPRFKELCRKVAKIEACDHQWSYDESHDVWRCSCGGVRQ